MNDEMSEQGNDRKPLSGLAADYPDALVRVASLRANQKHYLLFAWVELYPFDMTAPESWTAGGKPWNVPGSKGWSCAFSATKVATHRALQWYAHAASGSVNIALSAPKSILASDVALTSEPVLGKFSTGVDAPFTFKWHDGPRVHRLIRLKRPARPVFELGRNPAAREWLVSNAGFDPFSFDEWLGGVALVAPDPVCASFWLFPSDRSKQTGEETLSLQIVPRRSVARDADLKSLTVYVAERRVGAWASVAEIAVDQSGFATLPYPQPTGGIGYAVACKERGLLRFVQPHSWLNEINIQTSLGGRTAEIEVPAGGRRKPAQRYQVTDRSTAGALLIGGPVLDLGRQRLARLVRRRKNREELATAPQKIFGLPPSREQLSSEDVEAKKKEAQAYIVELVSRARNRLVFIDPFFGIRELRLFALRNPNTDVVPRILTGFPALKINIGTTPGFLQQQGAIFAADLKKLSEHYGPRTPVVRVMPGADTSIIHDRYLLIDDDVWHCGPSFNELGERLGVIVRLPNPLAIRRLVAQVWMESHALLELAPSSAVDGHG